MAGIIIFYILLLGAFVGICGMVFCLYKIDRSEKVYDFRIKILNMCNDYFFRHIDDKDILSKWCKPLDKYTFEQMLNSYKPLKMEVWYTDEEIKELKS